MERQGETHDPPPHRPRGRWLDELYAKVDLDALDLQSLNALQALLRDLETERTQAVIRAGLRP